MKTIFLVIFLVIIPLNVNAVDLTNAEINAIVEFFKLDASENSSVTFYPDYGSKWFIRIKGCKVSDKIEVIQSGDDLPAMVQEIKRIYLEINPED